VFGVDDNWEIDIRIQSALYKVLLCAIPSLFLPWRDNLSVLERSRKIISLETLPRWSGKLPLVREFIL
jgi:hypothetical protein